MHKIDSAGHVDNKFVAEDLATNRPPTEITADWMNALQEEPINVIAAAGLTLDKGDNTQLLQAINILIKGPADKIVRVASTAAINLAAPGANIDGTAMVAGDTFLEKDNATLADRGVYVWNGAAVPATRDPAADNGAELFGGMIIRVKQGTVNADTNWQVTNDGVVSIGVTGLTFAQVGTQNFSSNAEAQGFAVTDKSISPATLGQSLKGSNQLLSVNGYQKLPGGLIVQWGFTENVTTSTNITFPITFPNGVLSTIYGGKVASDTVGYIAAAFGSLTNSGMIFYSGTGSTGVGIRWAAIGY